MNIRQKRFPLHATWRTKAPKTIAISVKMELLGDVNKQTQKIEIFRFETCFLYSFLLLFVEVPRKMATDLATFIVCNVYDYIPFHQTFEVSWSKAVKWNATDSTHHV